MELGTHWAESMSVWSTGAIELASGRSLRSRADEAFEAPKNSLDCSAEARKDTSENKLEAATGSTKAALALFACELRRMS